VKTTIVYQPANKQLPQLVLEVKYRTCPAVKDTWVNSRFVPGSPAGVEVESVRCLEAEEDMEGIIVDWGWIIGDLVLKYDPKGVEKLVMEAHADEPKANQEVNEGIPL
jgi:hypothetical protein